MSARDAQAAVEWLAKGDTDLTSAGLLQGISGPAETVCFLSQQCAEKHLKGYLARHGASFRKVHDLLELLNACVLLEGAFAELVGDCSTLNSFSVGLRYPGYGVQVTGEDARQALASAHRVRDLVRKHLGLEPVA